MKKIPKKRPWGRVFYYLKLIKYTSMGVFLGVFSDFSEQLFTTPERLLRRTKTVTTTFPDNLRRSRQDVFFEIALILNIWKKVPGNHPSWNVLLANIKKNYTIKDFFPGIFSNFPEQLFQHFWVTASIICKDSWRAVAFCFFSR